MGGLTIVVGRNGKETVKNISNAIGATVEARYTLRSGTKVWRTNFNKQRRGYRPAINSGIVINWALQSDVSSGDAIVYNADGILKASNKPLARRLMAEAGVPVPETTEDHSIAINWIRSGFKVIQRAKQHHGGIGFKVITSDNGEVVEPYHYYQKFFRKTKEYRAHVAHGKILVMQEKVPVEGVEVNFDDVRPWNHATGDFVFNTIRWSEYNIGVCRCAVNATNALCLDFGAVDILWSEGEGAVVCEVNTSPSLAEYSTARYAKYFNWLSKSDERRPHWDSSNLTTGKDFAWKNGELTDDRLLREV